MKNLSAYISYEMKIEFTSDVHKIYIGMFRFILGAEYKKKGTQYSMLM